EISEKLELPVLLRTTTRVSHTRGPVVYGKMVKPRLKGEFVKDVKRMVMVPANARLMHARLLEKLEVAKEISEKSPYNLVTRKGKGEYGIISSSAAYNYAEEARELLGLDASVLKLGMTYPLPEKMIGDFLKAHEKIIVVEELEPYLEMQVKAIANDYAPNVKIYGKTGTTYFPRKGELSTRTVLAGMSKITGKETQMNFDRLDAAYEEISRDLPSRPPILCAGCPHMASFYVIGKATGKRAIYSTDIGCYALGTAPPLSIGDVLICMGASIGVAQGISKVVDKDVVAVVGDSTFFHAAIPGLVNAVYNRHKVVLVVLDNLTTAMTGHQPHPGTGKTGMQMQGERILVERVAEGCGVKYVKVVNPFNVKEAENTLKEALSESEPSVIVFRAPCALMVTRDRRRRGEKVTAYRVTDKCTNCMVCIKLLGCPALTLENEKVSINETLCVACGLCAAVCPYEAIEKG
ncbi:MAG: thiamine pyrophosphate-dependent enzyme, partial [Candidatus Bathyarchaeales archaeon]